ncbi:MAG: hypothetical protein NTU59_02165, partial [Coprothermobacterota bacterium]|nr:hypothetical protein [Coprothermobacterota bacterium]
QGPVEGDTTPTVSPLHKRLGLIGKGNPSFTPAILAKRERERLSFLLSYGSRSSAAPNEFPIDSSNWEVKFEYY